MGAQRADFSSPYYPYFKVIEGANGMRGSELIPYKLLQYLLDLPDAYGYKPIDDNDRPRVRLMKYLYYDTPAPLSNPLPTPEQKRSLLFDPDRPDINTDADKEKHPKGYRLFMQRIIGQSQLEAQTLIKCYPGRIFEPRKFETTIGITFEIWTNVNLLANTRTYAYDRSYDMEQCLHEALDGVNIDGVGTVSFARQSDTDNGSEPLYDEKTYVGRYVSCSVSWSEGGGGTVGTISKYYQ